MSAVRGGDTRQLAILFERHHTALFRFYVRMTGDRVRSEDMVQEVFWRILRYRETYRPGAQFTTWMYQIARNAHTDEWRKKRLEVEMAEGWDVPAEAGTSIEDQEEQKLIRQALARLHPAKRELLVLSRYQEMKYEQIGQMLGVEVATIKVRVHRAIKELKEIYAELTGEKQYEMRRSSDSITGLSYGRPDAGFAPPDRASS
jgi:RNA polymerase sigma-70 factor (ECF subfamily)